MLPCISKLTAGNFIGLVSEIRHTCTLELTVPTGLEEVAAQECREKMNVNPVAYRGRIIFDISIEIVPEVLKLRSVENINVFIGVEPHFELSSEREECFEKIYKFVNSLDWRKGIKVWQSVFGIENEDPFKAEQELSGTFCVPKPEVDLKFMKNDSIISANLPKELLSSIMAKNKEVQEKALKEAINKKEEESDKDKLKSGEKETGSEQRKGDGGEPKFRVSCHRVGSHHKFGSAEAARQFGGGINDKFGWPVDLTHFDLEVFLNIIEEFVYVTFSLTKTPLFKRNLTFFGPTNLRSTICYSMIRLAKPEPGDFIVDPMCGGCSIPIEGALTYPQCFHLGGDIFEAASTRSQMNISHLEKKKGKSLPLDSLRWDSTSLPLRDQVVDVMITDLPFGKRVGSKADNRVLYFKSLMELARVTKVESGRAVLLTYDKRTISKSLLRVSSLWKNFSTRSINIGGLIGAIYLLRRTNLLSDASISEDKNPKKRNPKRKHSSEKE